MAEQSSGRIGTSIANFFEGLLNYFIFLPYFFSVPALLKSLFKPWKNLASKKTTPGFSFGESMERFSFNLVSRGIGLVMRIFMLFFFLISELVYIIIMPLLVLVFFILLPFKILLSLLTPTEEARKEKLKKEFVAKHAIQPEYTPAVEEWFEKLYMDARYHAEWWKLEHLLSTPPLGRDWAVGYTPTLDKYTEELTSPTYQTRIKTIIGRQDEIKQIEEVLSKSEEANVVLVGEQGVGKRTIVEAMAKKLYEGRSNVLLNYKRMLLMNFEAILTENTDAQQRENFVEQLLQEAAEAKNIILVIENMEKYVSGEDPTHVDLSSALEKYAKSSGLQIIGITTPFLYEKFIFPNAAISQLFTKIDVREVSEEKALEIILDIAPQFEHRYRVTLPYDTLKTIAEKSQFYITNIPFPEKAIELLDSACSFTSHNKKTVLLPQDIDTIISQVTHAPTVLDAPTKETLVGFETIMSKRIIAQDQALLQLSAALRRSFLLLGNIKKPLASFLFLGPTGVGKTETAKVIAEIFFHDEKKLLRFDMSLYQSKDDIPNLVGSMEKGSPGLLTEQIRTNPYSVLLLDEIEKAHKDLLNIFLTVFDEGYYTDGLGKRVDCKNLIIIATSNAASEYLFGGQKNPTNLINYLVEKHYFSPEFLNRFDGVIAFSPLDENALFVIGNQIVAKLKDNYLKLHKVNITVSEATLRALIKTLPNKEFGARNLERAITQQIEDRIAKEVLAGTAREGTTLEF